ncbi:hypothetical protein O6P43_021041 [Quillaja saponaria]|uniref:Uncharacterized protein n=1 Tax=Quillaja saponaria TaxID=32244 RepID=A0AAD7LM14_QUISA|nr:hypothetical protein O6P43_021041 [Quillaja saponaria]
MILDFSLGFLTTGYAGILGLCVGGILECKSGRCFGCETSLKMFLSKHLLDGMRIRQLVPLRNWLCKSWIILGWSLPAPWQRWLPIP